MEYVNKEEVLKKIERKIYLYLKIKKRKLKILENIIRKIDLDNLALKTD